jgi:hypothetical protein
VHTLIGTLNLDLSDANRHALTGRYAVRCLVLAAARRVADARLRCHAHQPQPIQRAHRRCQRQYRAQVAVSDGRIHICFASH